MAGSFTYIRFHVVFSTKERHPWISDDWKEELYKYLAGIIRGEGGKLLKVNGGREHVHLLLGLRSDQAISDLVRLVKTNSSKWIHEKLPDLRAFQWQSGYGAFSVSRSGVQEVGRYIDAQPTHHQKTTFQEEFLAFLKAHEIPYDERYIWQ